MAVAEVQTWPLNVKRRKLVEDRMFAIVALAATMALTPPLPRGDPATWVPAQFLQTVTNQEGTTFFDLMIDTNGTPVSCVVAKSSGIAGLDHAVCSALIRNGRFKPALDENGTASPGVWSDNVHWKPIGMRGEHTRYTLPPADIEIAKPVSEASSRDVVVQTTSMVNADGSVANCTVAKPARSRLLNEQACETVRGLKTLRTVRDASGVRIRGIRAITVKFVTTNP